MKQQINNFLCSCRYKVLAASVAAISTVLVTTSVTQASDIEIYQDAKSGDITLMFMLDISNSMNNTDSGVTGTRIARVKKAMVDLLQGNASKGIARISDDKIIGLSTLGHLVGNTGTNFKNTGAVWIPARRLNEQVGGITQRQLLINTINSITAYTNTPTARSFAETVAYFMGTTTASRERTVDEMPYYRSYDYDTSVNIGTKSRPNWITQTTTVMQKCTAWNNSYSSCNTWQNSNDSAPSGENITSTNCNFDVNNISEYNEKCYFYSGIIEIANNNSGFQYSKDETKNTEKIAYSSPISLDQNEDIKQCSGQGIYVLTDGEPTQDSGSLPLMQGALGSMGQDFTCNDTTWGCLGALNERLLDASKNPKGLKFKTAVVGFGSGFNGVSSYDPNKTQAQNLAQFLNSNGTKKTNLTNVQEAAYWGVIGEGGWYSGNSSQDVVDSVNEFISNLSKDIPSVTTGSPVIPRDALNPAELQDQAYYQTFQPTPNTNYQLWLGNLKKYLVADGGVLKAKSGATVFNSDGSLKEPVYDDNGLITSAVYDYWAKTINVDVENGDENTIGSRKFSARGGAWSQMLLGATAQNKAQRKLFTNRKAVTSGSLPTFGGTGSLRQVELADIEDSIYKNDPDRGYLLSLLGYNIDLNNLPTTINELKARPSLRQMGAVMHSYPVLVTNKGKLAYNTTTKAMESTNREDYILFGTTQGLLHVVDAETGVEKFAFVPNEMVDNQKDAFRHVSVTTQGMQNLYYGIDGPWALYTQYVADSSGNLVVGTGRNSQKGMQIAYGGLRMGGRSYYALDLSDINSPELKFHIDPASKKVYSSNSSTTFSELEYMGQSWSKPAITWINWGGERKRVMFVGGGYDAGGTDGDARTNGVKGLYSGYENHDYNQTNKIGAGVYMFDADNGDLLWWASDNASASSAITKNDGVIATKHSNLKYSVTSEIRTVDRDGDDLVDHIYFGDLGGQLFRIDFDNKQNTKGAVPKAPIQLLNLNAAEKSPRFYDMPSFSLYNQNGDIFAVISIGSGNRSQPLRDYTTTLAGYDYDAIYNIYDKDVARRDLFSATTWNTLGLEKSDLGEITESNRFSNTEMVAKYEDTGGWFYRFQNCTVGVDGTTTGCSNYKKQSEKVFGTPLAMNYKLYVSTFDASKPGISGDCGAGVKGESMLTAFCLPFGQCATEIEPSRSVIGVGIHTVTVGGQKSNGDGGGDDEECTGENCPPTDCEGETCLPEATGNTSAKNYCINTSGRIALTVTGSFGSGEATKMCLIPQRWYEKLGRRIS
ncbi:pilus assembly protein PilY [Acinetobacter indicus]|uniref:pilus assembly protein PilY n=1 Tax=Acinetobacter indicus TaxID=756892 RepID=UPI0039891798